MGLFMRVSAFRGVSHADVYAALAEFWSRNGRRVDSVPLDARTDTFDLYEQRGGWTVLDWTRGWEWTLRRQAQLYVSETLGCAGILVFIYDGDDWGFELFERGSAVDWFIQRPQAGNTWFPGKDLGGRPGAVAAAFPELSLDRKDIAPYLVQSPDDDLDPEEFHTALEQWDVRARPGDRFTRGDDFAALEFLNLLDVGIDFVGEGFRWRAPLSRRFRVEPPPTDEERDLRTLITSAGAPTLPRTGHHTP